MVIFQAFERNHQMQIHKIQVGDSTWNDPIEVATENSIYVFFFA